MNENEKVSCPRNQMFVAFEASSTVAKRRFKASIIENSIQYDNSFHKVYF